MSGRREYLLILQQSKDMHDVWLIHVVEVVSHALLLGVHVEAVVFVRHHFDGHVLHHFKTIAFKSHAFLGIVGHQSHFLHTQNTKYVSSHAIVTFIGFESQVGVGIYRVKAFLLLQFIDLKQESMQSHIMTDRQYPKSTLSFYATLQDI